MKFQRYLFSYDLAFDFQYADVCVMETDLLLTSTNEDPFVCLGYVQSSSGRYWSFSFSSKDPILLSHAFKAYIDCKSLETEQFALDLNASAFDTIDESFKGFTQSNWDNFSSVFKFHDFSIQHFGEDCFTEQQLKLFSLFCDYASSCAKPISPKLPTPSIQGQFPSTSQSIRSAALSVFFCAHQTIKNQVANQVFPALDFINPLSPDKHCHGISFLPYYAQSMISRHLLLRNWVLCDGQRVSQCGYEFNEELHFRYIASQSLHTGSELKILASYLSDLSASDSLQDIQCPPCTLSLIELTLQKVRELSVGVFFPHEDPALPRDS